MLCDSVRGGSQHNLSSCSIGNRHRSEQQVLLVQGCGAVIAVAHCKRQEW